ncbi:hypothetical protein ACLOJK_039829 [Asimina triloba]
MPSSSMHSKPPNLQLPPPAVEKPPSGKQPLPQFSSQGLKCRPRASRDLESSRDDAYFDSQAWLESDCEDDFLSVNGDLTPSCGSTPTKRSSNPASPPLSKASSMDRRPTFMPETSADDKKTRLSELLKDDSHDEQPADNQDISSPLTSVNGKQSSDSANAEIPPPKSLEGSSDKSQNKDSKHEKMKSAKSSQCCIPSLVEFANGIRL